MVFDTFGNLVVAGGVPSIAPAADSLDTDFAALGTHDAGGGSDHVLVGLVEVQQDRR